MVSSICYTAHHSETPQSYPDPPSYNSVTHQQIRTAISQLKGQHSSLSKLYQHPTSPIPNRMPSVLDTAEEEECSTPMASPTMASPVARHPHRISRASAAASSRSDSIHEWYDAIEDGPEEFVVHESVIQSEHQDHQPSQVTVDSSSLIYDHTDGSSVDTDIGEEPLPSAGQGTHHIEYRTELPVPAPEDEGSLFAILKRNVGKVCALSAA